MFNIKVSGVSAVLAFIFSFFIGLVSGAAMPLLIMRPIVFALVFFAIAGIVYYLVSRFLPELLAADSVEAPSDFLGSRINITEGDTNFSPDYASGSLGNSAGDSLTPEPQTFMGAQPDDSDEEVGNIADLLKKRAGSLDSSSGFQNMDSAGIDQIGKDGYNTEGNLEELPEQDVFMPWEPVPLSGGSSPGPEKPQASPKQAVSEEPQGSGSGYSGSAGSADFFPDLDIMAGAFSPSSGGGSSESSLDSSGGYSAPASSSRRSKDSGWSGDFNAKDMAMGLRTVLNKEKEG